MDPKYSQTGFKYHIIVLQKQLHMATTTDLLGYVMDRIGYCVTYHPYTYITYQILHYSPLIISQSLRSLDNKYPQFSITIPNIHLLEQDCSDVADGASEDYC